MMRIVTIIIVVLVALTAAGCVTDSRPTTRERELYAERALLEEQARLEEESADSYVRKLIAETDAYNRRILLEMDAGLVKMETHLLMMENIETALRHTSDNIVPLGENARAAAENSWWANIWLIILSCGFAGLVALVVITAAKTERRVVDIAKKLDQLAKEDKE